MIQFPEDKSVRKRLQNRAQERKSVLVMSLASVFVMAVFLNQWLVTEAQSQSAVQGNRGIASFQPQNMLQEVKWEHELAKKLSNESAVGEMALAERPTLRDDLIFGYLEGKYGMKVLQGQVRSLEFIDAQAGEQPLDITDKHGFLTEYAAAFGIPYEQVSLKESSADQQLFNLIAGDRTIVGQALFSLDHNGRVLALTITQ